MDVQPVELIIYRQKQHFMRHRILDAIKRHRSLQAAAKELKMGYRALWERIKASEERLKL